MKQGFCFCPIFLLTLHENWRFQISWLLLSNWLILFLKNLLLFSFVSFVCGVLWNTPFSFCNLLKNNYLCIMDELKAFRERANAHGICSMANMWDKAQSKKQLMDLAVEIMNCILCSSKMESLWGWKPRAKWVPKRKSFD